ncbi:energy-coupling factor transporter transmembrane component T [Micromonospora craniellae]|uniref:Energy-coupling factor transporter transmembrane protein EcfT n=1 Tax=Micromonospora craniellae TaxID=2294034 RepID=A0A372FXX9_9ACTN|nr:energy-coupling factor transporter transmembrane component T [Micromonospora craniellae]RFS45593.1 energy-coupling factor transporter transmembrane protein EcfT [Micromonospora craniellae]
MPSADRTGLDPRTKILTVIAVSAAVLGTGGNRFIVAGTLLAVGLAVWERVWRRAVLLPLVVGVFAAFAFWVPIVWPHPVLGIISIGSLYTVRFAVAVGVGMHLVATTSPTQLSAAFRAWRIPRGIAVSTSVMLRFFPLVTSEAGAVLDAMRLRGLVGAGVVRHPVLAIERFTVPLIASSLRVGEDLAASAILRGLGSPHRPTSMTPPRFTWRDAAFAVALALLAGASIVVWRETT